VTVERVVVGVHIPKCAGISILSHVQKSIPESEIYQCTSINDNFLFDRPEFRHLVFKDRLRFVWGHHVHDEMLKQLRRPMVVFTGLRHPIARINSEVNFVAHQRKYQGKPFDPAVELAGTRNPMCWFLITRFPSLAGEEGNAADRAMRVLVAFNWVYFSENFDESVAAIFGELGLTAPVEKMNVGRQKIAYEIDHAAFAYDIELYDRARAYFSGRDVASSLRELTPAMQAMLDEPVNHNRMRRYLYRVSYHEYQTWNSMDEVIRNRLQMIEEVKFELNYYKMLDEQR